MRPLIGITIDRAADPDWREGRYQTGVFISRSVTRAGGLPVLMTPQPELAAQYADTCHGFVFTGGLDPDTAEFGEPMHPKARKMDAQRQAFELVLLDELNKRSGERGEPGAGVPVLGICLGMQMMALHAGGSLNQYMPDTLDNPALHQGGASHAIHLTVSDSALEPSDEAIHSAHQQAVQDPGKMRVIATAPDGTVEAIDGRPMDAERFYLGVQWHPERGGDGPTNLGLFYRLMEAVRRSAT
jgi:putative glutamine amidotransferase